MNDQVTINVGGQLFTTTQTTLSSSSFFKTMFERWSNQDKVEFIDRSPKLFEHVINFLRDPQYPYPNTHLSELDFYGIDHNIQSEEDRFDKFEAEIMELANVSFNIVEKFTKQIESLEHKIANLRNEHCIDIKSLSTRVNSLETVVQNLTHKEAERNIAAHSTNSNQTNFSFLQAKGLIKCAIPSCMNNSDKGIYCVRCRICDPDIPFEPKTRDLVSYNNKVYYFQKDYPGGKLYEREFDMGHRAYDVRAANKTMITRPTPLQMEQFILGISG